MRDENDVNPMDEKLTENQNNEAFDAPQKEVSGSPTDQLETPDTLTKTSDVNETSTEPDNNQADFSENKETQTIGSEPITQPTPDDSKPSSNPQPITSAPEAEKPASPFEQKLASATSKKSHKGLLISIILAVIIIAAGLLVYFFWYQNPEKVVSDGVMNAIKAKTATFNGAAKYTPADTETVSNLTINFNGVTNRTNTSLNLETVATINEQETNLKISTMFADTGTAYVKVANVDSFVEAVIGDTTDLSGMIDSVNDKWISVEPSYTGELSEEVGKAQQCLKDTLKGVADDEAIQKEIAELYGKNKFMTVGNKVADKNGSFGYQININQSTLSSFIKGLASTKFATLLNNCSSEKVDYESLASTVSDSEDKTTGTITVWVSKFGHQITGVDMTAASDNNQLHLLTDIVINDKAEISTPTDAKSLKDVMTSLVDDNEYSVLEEEL